MATAKPDKQPGFEKALERLETIVREMEGGDLGLDRLMSHFEEGMRLVKLCTEKLNEVERKIEQLVSRDGQAVIEPLAVPADEPVKEP